MLINLPIINSLGCKDSQHKRAHRRSSYGFRKQVRYHPSRNRSFDTCECTLNEPGGDDGCYVGSECLREEEDHDPVITSIRSDQTFALPAAVVLDERIEHSQKGQNRQHGSSSKGFRDRGKDQRPDSQHGQVGETRCLEDGGRNAWMLSSEGTRDCSVRL